MLPLTLTTRDGVVLHGRWLPATRRRRGTAVVLAHGFTASMSNPEVEAFATDLAVDGHDVLMYDARGHKDSGGFCTLGDAEQYDVEAAVEEARRRSGKVVLFGASMGAIAILRYAATDPELAGVVALSSPARWRMPRSISALVAVWMSRTRSGRWFARRALGVRIHTKWTNAAPPEQLVARIKAPLAVVHGLADRFIPSSEARVLARQATGPTRLNLVPRMGHAFDARGIPSIRSAVNWALAF